MNTITRQTEEVTIDGKPIVKIKMNGEWHSFYAEGDNLIEYDQAINNISFSYEMKTSETGEKVVFRAETKKILKLISEGRVIGFHEYKTPKTENTILKAIIVWNYVKGSWYPSSKKGISALSTEDISILKTGITEIGW